MHGLRWLLRNRLQKTSGHSILFLSLLLRTQNVALLPKGVAHDYS